MVTTTASNRYVLMSLLGAFLPFFGVIWLTIGQTGGYYEYPLDDPYIHLAMSEQIANGGYGVNAGEYASASSSILFPFLLAPFAGFEWHWLTPLFWGAIGLFASAYLWGRFVGDIARTAKPNVQAYLIMFALIGPLILHMVGVSLVGMEHGLQVLAAMMVAYGLIRYAEEDKIDWLLIAGVILSPMLRFEGLAVSCFACAVLLFTGRAKVAIALGVAALIPVVIYVLAMASIGLAPLPNSVMAKAAIVGGDTHFVEGEEETRLATLINTIKTSFESASGYPLLVMSFFWIAAAWIWRKVFGRTRVLLALTIPALALAHFFLGSIGIFYRYEIYAWAFGGVMSLYLLSRVWDRYALAARFAPVAFLVAVVIMGKHYPLQTLFVYPNAGAAIGVQQKQMGRFVDDYIDGPVAVNDLGHVAYDNPHYVLDLWGLASREALDARLAGRDPNWADDLLARYDVGVIMIYDWWFTGRINPDWIKVAEMEITRDAGALGGKIVAFYAVSQDDLPKLRADLEAFGSTLPEGVAFRLID